MPSDKTTIPNNNKKKSKGADAAAMVRSASSGSSSADGEAGAHVNGRGSGGGGGGIKKKKTRTTTVQQTSRIVSNEALFLWEVVATFSTPRIVCNLEQVCWPIRDTLLDASKGTHTMQRYWNAQYHRLVWEADQLDPAKRFLTFSLSKNEGRKNWKLRYAEEYPLYIQRTFQGAGVCNNATNVAKVLTEKVEINEHLSASQMEKLEMTEEESLLKAAAKSAGGGAAMALVSSGAIEGGGEGGGEAGGDGVVRHHKTDAKGRRKGHGNKPRSERPMKDPSMGLDRADYHDDPRQRDRKDKHKKGGMSKWSTYAYFDEYI